MEVHKSSYAWWDTPCSEAKFSTIYKSYCDILATLTLPTWSLVSGLTLPLEDWIKLSLNTAIGSSFVVIAYVVCDSSR